MAERSDRFFCSWSGGKDSCLALYRAVRGGGEPAGLLTMLVEDGRRSRSHGLPLEVLEAQAASLGIPLTAAPTSWEEYERHFVDAVRALRSDGVSKGVFGDIDLEEHLEWVERVCSEAGVEASEPLWGADRMELLREFISAGFVAVIVSVKEGCLGQGMLGRALDEELISQFQGAGIDPSGEKGEYHTVVVSGPMFSSPLTLKTGGAALHDGYWFLDVSLERG